MLCRHKLWMERRTDGCVYEWTFVGYFLCSKYPTITPKVPNNHLRNKGHLMFLLFRSTQQVSWFARTDGRTDGKQDAYIALAKAGATKKSLNYPQYPLLSRVLCHFTVHAALILYLTCLFKLLTCKLWKLTHTCTDNHHC